MDIEGVRNSAFMGPNSAFISDICADIGTYIGILIELFLPRAFKYDLVSLFVRVVYSITIFTFVAFIDMVLLSSPD